MMMIIVLFLLSTHTHTQMFFFRGVVSANDKYKEEKIQINSHTSLRSRVVFNESKKMNLLFVLKTLLLITKVNFLPSSSTTHTSLFLLFYFFFFCLQKKE